MTRPETTSDGCPRNICREIEDKFFSKTRDNLTKEDVLFLSAELPLLNNKTHLYFLPVVIEAALEDINSVDFDQLVQDFFCYPGQRDYKKFQKIRLEAFSMPQADAILSVIEFWLNKEKIDAYWREDLIKSLPFWRKRAKR